MNISNKFLEFEPVVRELAASIGMAAIRIDSPFHAEQWITPATWMLLSAVPERLADLATRATPAGPRGALWTDDYANVLAILR